MNLLNSSVQLLHLKFWKEKAENQKICTSLMLIWVREMGVVRGRVALEYYWEQIP